MEKNSTLNHSLSLSDEPKLALWNIHSTGYPTTSMTVKLYFSLTLTQQLVTCGQRISRSGHSYLTDNHETTFDLVAVKNVNCLHGYFMTLDLHHTVYHTHTHRHTETQTDTHTHRHRQTDIQTDRDTDRQTEMQLPSWLLHDL